MTSLSLVLGCRQHNEESLLTVVQHVLANIQLMTTKDTHVLSSHLFAFILVLHVDAYCVSHLRTSTSFTSALSHNPTLPHVTCVSLSVLL